MESFFSQNVLATSHTCHLDAGIVTAVDIGSVVMVSISLNQELYS